MSARDKIAYQYRKSCLFALFGFSKRMEKHALLAQERILCRLGRVFFVSQAFSERGEKV